MKENSKAGVFGAAGSGRGVARSPQRDPKTVTYNATYTNEMETSAGLCHRKQRTSACRYARNNKASEPVKALVVVLLSRPCEYALSIVPGVLVMSVPSKRSGDFLSDSAVCCTC